MSAPNSMNQINFQVQNNLFHYFYFHNRTSFEGTFCSPKELQILSHSIEDKSTKHQSDEIEAEENVKLSPVGSLKRIKTSTKVN